MAENAGIRGVLRVLRVLRVLGVARAMSGGEERGHEKIRGKVP
jgi:hypothetical protein